MEMRECSRRMGEGEKERGRRGQKTRGMGVGGRKKRKSKCNGRSKGVAIGQLAQSLCDLGKVI